MAMEKRYLKIKDATLGYENKVIFRNLNIEFECGKITAILGKSGCGKTTVLRTLAGLLIPEVGTITYDSKRITEPNEQICMMHQKYVNFPWLTCLENVIIGGQGCKGQLPPKKYGRNVDNVQNFEAYDVLKKVGLEEYALNFPHELSGGMNQRLALARVIYRNPKVILMDEPLSALDPKTRKDMQKLLTDLHYQTNNTIIMVTHDPDEAKKMCHNIINL